MKDLDDVKAFLESPSTVENCSCAGCEKRRQEAGVYKCDCGYVGLLAAAECACYDENAWYCRPDARGSGCFHGSLTCPWCDAGEVSGSEVLAALRDALVGKPDTTHAKRTPWDERRAAEWLASRDLTFEAQP